MTTHDRNCPHEALSAYLDGELDAEQHAALEKHLAGCRKCQTLLEDMRLLASVGSEEEIPPVPDGLAERIARKLPVPLAPRRRRWIDRMPMAAAAGLAGAALLWVALQSGPTPLKDAVVGQKAASETLKESLGNEEANLPDSPLPGEAKKDQGRREAILSDSKAPQSAPAPLESKAKSSLESTARKDESAPGAAELSDLGKLNASEPTPVAPPPPTAEEPAKRAAPAREETAPGEAEELRFQAAQKNAPTDRSSAADAEGFAAGDGDNRKAGRDEIAMERQSLARRLRENEDDLPRTFSFDGGGYSLRLFETGVLSLHAEGYKCTVDSPATAAERDADAEEDSAFLDALFASAGDAPQTLGGISADPEGRFVLSAEDRARVLARYRARLEEQCGPLPEGIEPQQ